MCMMRVVGLVSGGKDSCYNLLQCVAAGHQVVALANLAPSCVDELDSYMYQSVGHMGVAFYAEAVGVPLYRRVIQGTSLNTATITYKPTEGDEVEDLFLLLKEVKEKCCVDAVSVGAVLSDYQRVRVENVCSRLGLVCLAYMWRRDQSELLQEMVECGLEAIIIKVAAIGLEPRKHLGKSISQMVSYLEKMKEKYRLNVCGEGGEYETFTLDCPIFKKRIVVQETEMVETSGDVAYLNLKSLELVDKEIPDEVSHVELVSAAGIRCPEDFLTDLKLAEEEQQAEDQAKESHIEVPETSINSYQPFEDDIDSPEVPDDLHPGVIRTVTGFTFAGSFSGNTADEAILKLKECLLGEELELHHLVCVKMYVQDINDYVQLNAQYIKYFSVNPPVRVCVEVPLPSDVRVQLDVSGWRQSHVTAEVENDQIHSMTRTTMHVQGISHWAPANIGPYSQAVKVGSVVVVAGMIGLVPGTLQVVSGGVEVEARLALRHVSRVITAVAPSTDIRAVVQGVCYVTRLSDIAVARRMMARLSESQISTYVVVPALPRAALLEWQTWGCVENDKFEYEEKGYSRGNVNVRLRRRWYHDNSVCAVNTTASCFSSEDLTCEILEEVIQYTISKAETTMPFGLTLFYRSGGVSRSLLQQAIVQTVPQGLATTSLVPVLAVEDNHTLLTVTATRY